MPRRTKHRDFCLCSLQQTILNSRQLLPELFSFISQGDTSCASKPLNLTWPLLERWGQKQNASPCIFTTVPIPKALCFLHLAGDRVWHVLTPCATCQGKIVVILHPDPYSFPGISTESKARSRPFPPYPLCLCWRPLLFPKQTSGWQNIFFYLTTIPNLLDPSLYPEKW